MNYFYPKFWITIEADSRELADKQMESLFTKKTKNVSKTKKSNNKKEL